MEQIEETTSTSHIFVCTNKSKKECLDRKLFSTNKIYASKVYKVRSGQQLFLLNIDTDVLYSSSR
jgi:hypothetical protein